MKGSGRQTARRARILCCGCSTRSTRLHVFVEHDQHPGQKQKQRGNNGMPSKHEGHPKDCDDESNLCHPAVSSWPSFTYYNSRESISATRCSSSRTNDHALLSVANVRCWHFSYLVRCPICPEWAQSGHPSTAPNSSVHALDHSCGGLGSGPSRDAAALATWLAASRSNIATRACSSAGSSILNSAFTQRS